MTWKEAKEGTLRQWMAIRDLIGSADTVTLLTEINAVCDLCEKTDEVAGTPFSRCDYCLFYQQFGGCREVSAELSEMVVNNQLYDVRALVEDMIDKTRKLQVPEAREPLLAIV